MYLIGTNRTTRGEDSVYDNRGSFQYLRYGEVVQNTDENGLGRIKVRIKGSTSTGGDDGIDIIDLADAFPLLPKHISVIPKLGEMVWVFVLDKTKQHSDRLYVGPIISQLEKLNYDKGQLGALNGFSFGPTQANTNPETIAQIDGVFPNKEDISIQGRYNTDITQKVNEVIIRAGKFEKIAKNANNPLEFQFNTKTQGYIQIKNDMQIISNDRINNEYSSGENLNDAFGSITTIVANKINLITHKEGSPRFNVTGQEELITDKEMNRILTEAHQLPFGDVLLQYLKLLKDALFSHVHNSNGKPPTDLTADGNIQALAAFKAKAEDLENSMLSKNIRIN